MSDATGRNALAHQQVDRNFSSHTPNAEQRELMSTVRAACCGTAHLIIDYVPEGRERAMALTKLEEACMHAIAGVVRPPAPSR